MRYEYKYSTFFDYVDEIENYATRRERLYAEFYELDSTKHKRLLEWLEAAFKCGRENQNAREIND